MTREIVAILVGTSVATISAPKWLAGFLYVVDGPLTDGVDIYRHPAASINNGVEWLTKRHLI